MGRQHVAFPIDDLTELRVLKVSLGTNHVLSNETLWKQVARWVLPDSILGTFQGHRHRTSYPALVVWVGHFSRKTGWPEPVGFNTPEAVFSDGTVVRGRKVQAWGPTSGCFEFRCFERAARDVQLAARLGTNRIVFTVRNPRPAPAGKWTALPLPQTNRLARTEVVLRNLRAPMGATHVASAVGARATSDANIGWVQWRTTIFDPFGNWDQSGWEGSFGSPGLDLGYLPRNAAVWKVAVEGREYVSAGFTAVPDQTMTHYTIEPKGRLTYVGVTFLMVAGPGRYQIKGGIAQRSGGPAPGQPVLMLDRNSVATVVLDTSMPGVFCVSENPAVRARLRERIGASDGRIFYASTSTNITDITGKSASFFGCRFLPTRATNLEVEVIAPVGPAEYFVRAIK
jgi:hypothetical protein